MNSASQLGRGIYCLGCHYNLRGLASNRCPECGRTFDPADPKTFSRQERPTPVKDLLSRVGKAVEQAIDQAVRPAADVDAALQRLRSLRSVALAGEVERLRRENQVLRAQFDQVVQIMVDRGMLDEQTVVQVREAAERAAATPIEFVEPEEPVALEYESGAEETSPELLELQRAAEEREPKSG